MIASSAAAAPRRRPPESPPMLAYILRRLVIALVAIFVLATITFFLMRLVPGDPFASPRITHRGQGAPARPLRPR